MKISRVVLPFKGSRDYIHGTELFNLMISSEKNSLVRNLRFSVHGFIHHALCDLYITESQEELLVVEDVKARCELEVDGVKRWMGVVPCEGISTTPTRYEYDESEITTLCRIDEEGITLLQESAYTFIEIIVAMNKAMLQRLFPEVSGKWVFTRIDMPVLQSEKKDIALLLKHNLNFRLTKSDILIKGEKIGELYFSLVKP